MKAKISGVVVFYNPKIEVINNIDSYIKKLEKLYIIDNSEVLNEEIVKQILKRHLNVEYIPLGDNLGIAKALNVGIERFLNSDSDFFLTMDQDSYFNENHLEKFIEKILLEKEPGIFSPTHKTSAKKFIEKQDRIVEKVMTSGNILSREVMSITGNFNENFFIDEVDHEYCFRARKKGYQIKLYGDIYLNHSLGDTNKKNRLPKFLIPTNHNSVRRYYITRNKLYMSEMFPELKFKYTLTFFNDLMKIILLEKQKLNKLKMIKNGYIDYKNKITGKYGR